MSPGFTVPWKGLLGLPLGRDGEVKGGQAEF